MNKLSRLRKYLTISEDDRFQVYLRRPPNSCFFENYFKFFAGWHGYRASVQ